LFDFSKILIFFSNFTPPDAMHDRSPSDCLMYCVSYERGLLRDVFYKPRWGMQHVSQILRRAGTLSATGGWFGFRDSCPAWSGDSIWRRLYWSLAFGSTDLYSPWKETSWPF
jgi:hypothetical protein